VTRVYWRVSSWTRSCCHAALKSRTQWRGAYASQIGFSIRRPCRDSFTASKSRRSVLANWAVKRNPEMVAESIHVFSLSEELPRFHLSGKRWVSGQVNAPFLGLAVDRARSKPRAERPSRCCSTPRAYWNETRMHRKRTRALSRSPKNNNGPDEKSCRGPGNGLRPQ